MRTSLYEKTKYKAILSGNTLEFYQFEKRVYYNFSAPPIKESAIITEAQRMENRARSKSRSHKSVRRLMHANFGMWNDWRGKPYISKMLTLTYGTPILTPEEGNPEFTLFIKRLNYKLFNTKEAVIRYICAIEFQPISKRVHYHLALFNLPYIDRIYDVFNTTWDKGWMIIKRIHDAPGAANYITKYITKEDDARLTGNKSYFCSRGLYRPITLREEVFCTSLKNLLLDEKALYQYSFENEHTGKTDYASYDLSKNQGLRELILANQTKKGIYSNQ